MGKGDVITTSMNRMDQQGKSRCGSWKCRQSEDGGEGVDKEGEGGFEKWKIDQHKNEKNEQAGEKVGRVYGNVVKICMMRMVKQGEGEFWRWK